MSSATMREQYYSSHRHMSQSGAGISVLGWLSSNFVSHLSPYINDTSSHAHTAHNFTMAQRASAEVQRTGVYILRELESC